MLSCLLTCALVFTTAGIGQAGVFPCIVGEKHSGLRRNRDGFKNGDRDLCVAGKNGTQSDDCDLNRPEFRAVEHDQL